jgi:DNA polymerase-3 subunit epsilon
VIALLAALGAMIMIGLPPQQAAVLEQVLDQRAPVLGFAALILAFLCAGVVRWLFTSYVAAADALAEQTLTLAGGGGAARVSSEGAPQLQRLAQAVNLLAQALRRHAAEAESRVAESRAGIEEERNRLAALMSELTQGVLVCNSEGRILLYNGLARTLFAHGSDQAGASERIGLGRSVFALIDRDQITHALDRLQQALEQGVALPSTRFVAEVGAGVLLKMQMAPFLTSERQLGGFVLAFEDVSDVHAREEQRRSLLQTLASRIRRPAANVRAAAENLATFPDMDAAQRDRFQAIIAEESWALSAALDEALRQHADALKANLALEDMRASDLLASTIRRVGKLPGIEATVEDTDDSVWIRADSYGMAQALAFLASRLRDEHGVRMLRFRARPAAAFAEIDMVWSGTPVTGEALSNWERAAMKIGGDETPLSLKDVLERHGGEVWCQRDSAAGESWLRVILPQVQPVAAAVRRAPAAQSRPEFYDFDLFARRASALELAEHRLSELHYTVFDTETTGLEPSAGDEIISIGAVRIVNGRLLKGEIFDQLVGPARMPSRESIRVHGIEPRELRGQPAAAEVLPRFHRFCEDSVLVAHNAAFDMRFLELQADTVGVRFGQPVLDTLLLSALVHPSTEDHRLEAIAERLGVSVVGRHTALGDALVTAEIFLKLLPLLAGKGVSTLGEALAASRETYFARLQY